MGPHITGEVAGTGAWTMGLCFSPRLPAAALSPGAAREAEPSKAQQCTRRVPSAAAQRPGRGRGAPLSHPPQGRTMLLFPEGFRPLLPSSSLWVATPSVDLGSWGSWMGGGERWDHHWDLINNGRSGGTHSLLLTRLQVTGNPGERKQLAFLYRT